MKRTYPSPSRHPSSRFVSPSLLRYCAPALLAFALLAAPVSAETCTTQSALAPSDRAALADAARNLAALVQANNASALQALAVPALAHDFASFQYLLGNTAPRLTGASFSVDQLYLLDASTLKLNADGSSPDAQFVCSLNRTTMTTEFSIAALPPGRYAFALVITSAPPTVANPSPWRLAFLLHQDTASRQMADRRLLPRPHHGRRARRPVVLDPGPPVPHAQTALERLALLSGCGTSPPARALRSQYSLRQAAH